MAQQYVYIVQTNREYSTCKIGKTNDIEHRLKEYNNMTGKSKDSTYQYLFICEVSDMAQLDKDIKVEFSNLRKDNCEEIYFYNSSLLGRYVDFIREHKCFVKKIYIKQSVQTKLTKTTKSSVLSLKERGLTRKDVMQKAQDTDNDEFYTRYEDVEKELSMYDKSIWLDKVVLCNCDDACDTADRNTSAFVLYFLLNFKKLGIEKLICTHYRGDLLNQDLKGYVFTRIFKRDGFKEEKEYPSGYDGSFDHPLSLKILNEEVDIVCTNPPFSKAKDYWKVLIDSGKKFIIISNISNPIQTGFIHYFKNNKVWAGYNSVDFYENPKRQITDAPGHWYTNIPIKDRPKYKLLKIVPLENIPVQNKKYDDSKMLLVDRGYIPSDYEKPFAVSTRSILNGVLEKGYNIVQEKRYTPYVEGSEKFARVLIQKV